MVAAKAAVPLNILSIATLFPDAARPNFGLFVERSLRALVQQEGVRLTVVAPLGLPPFPLSLPPRYRALRGLPQCEERGGLTVLRPRFTLWPRIGTARNPARIAAAILPVVRALHAADPFDVVDAQFFYPDGPAAMRIAGALGLPFSAKARGADISHFGHAAGTAAQVIEAGARAGGLLAVSAAMRADMAALGIDAGKIRVHYTGIDAGRFHPGDRAAGRTRHGLPPAAPLLLSVGALIPRKGQALVIDALPALPGVHYALAGSGEMAADYRARAERLGVADRVHLLGPVANADLPELYRAADIVVMPSVSEGLANAWVEALACGTPLVISDAGGAAELVQSPQAGRIVERNSMAIADAVRSLLATPQDPAVVAATLGGRFDWDRNGAELADHLRHCAAIGRHFS